MSQAAPMAMSPTLIRDTIERTIATNSAIREVTAAVIGVPPVKSHLQTEVLVAPQQRAVRRRVATVIAIISISLLLPSRTGSKSTLNRKRFSENIMRKIFLATVATCCVAAVANAAPFKSKTVPIDDSDLGATTPDQVITASLVLKVHNPAALEALLVATQDPNNFLYHRFLSVPEFVAFFAPSRFEIANIEGFLNQFGIEVTDIYENHLLIRARGTVAAFDKAFATEMHDFWRDGRRFHRPRHAPSIPLALRDIVIVVEGLNSEAGKFHPMNTNVRKQNLQAQPRAGITLPPAGATATGVPGDFTVGDVANLYNINTLYAANITGAGRTLGI